MKDDVDVAIAQYRSQLAAEAELARGDLAEIEDHLRMLIEALRAAGLPAGEAIAEAARRLGDPRQLAREHARVRTPFGAKLSRARAWSAVVLLLPYLVMTARWALHDGLRSRGGLELALGGTLIVALALRQAWARALVLGSLVTLAVQDAFVLIALGPSPYLIVRLACYAGAGVFLAPWRRGELTALGAALVLLGPAYSAAVTVVGLLLTAPGNVVLADPWGTLALAAVLVAALGGLVRARWAAIAAALAAFALVQATVGLWPLHVRMPSPELWRTMLLGSLVAGAAASAACAVLTWRAARSTLGTLRGVLS